MLAVCCYYFSTVDPQERISVEIKMTLPTHYGPHLRRQLLPPSPPPPRRLLSPLPRLSPLPVWQRNNWPMLAPNPPPQSLPNPLPPNQRDNGILVSEARKHLPASHRRTGDQCLREWWVHYSYCYSFIHVCTYTHVCTIYRSNMEIPHSGFTTLLPCPSPHHCMIIHGGSRGGQGD